MFLSASHREETWLFTATDSSRLHYSTLAKGKLPLPSAGKDILERRVCLPTKNLIGLVYVAPNLLNIAGTTAHDLIVELNTGSTLETVDEFKHAGSLACTDIVNLDVLVGLVLHDARHGTDVSLSEVYDIDVVADTTAVGSIVVIAEDAQFLADTDSCLGYVRNEVSGYTDWQLAD